MGLRVRAGEGAEAVARIPSVEVRVRAAVVHPTRSAEAAARRPPPPRRLPPRLDRATPSVAAALQGAVLPIRSGRAPECPAARARHLRDRPSARVLARREGPRRAPSAGQARAQARQDRATPSAPVLGRRGRVRGRPLDHPALAAAEEAPSAAVGVVAGSARRQRPSRREGAIHSVPVQVPAAAVVEDSEGAAEDLARPRQARLRRSGQVQVPVVVAAVVAAPSEVVVAADLAHRRRRHLPAVHLEEGELEALAKLLAI